MMCCKGLGIYAFCACSFHAFVFFFLLEDSSQLTKCGLFT